MLRWLLTLIVAAGCLGSQTVVRAQDNPWSGEPGRFIPWEGNGAWAPYGGYPPMSTPYGSQYSPYSASPPVTPPNAPAVAEIPGPRPQQVYEFQPRGDLRGPLFEDSPGQDRLRSSLQQSWFRVDYLNWDLKDPGESLVGADWINANARDPLHGFGSSDSLTSVIPLARERDGTVRQDLGGAFLIAGQAHDLSPFDFRHRNGIRLNFGFPTEAGNIEANIWGLKKNTDHYRIEPYFDNFGTFLVIPAIPLTNNGRLVNPTLDASAPMILFDEYMHVQYGQEMYGAEVNYFRKTLRDNDHLHVDLMGGGRFIRLREDMLVVGSDLRNQLNPEILSTSINHLFGPSIGLRAEMEFGIVKLGADTRLTAGFNRHNNTVRTKDLFLQNPNPTNSSDDHTEFAPIHDLKLYAQVQLTHHIKLRAGYDLLNIFQVSRPQNSVVWDDSGVVDGPINIRADATNLESFRASGFFVGGEISFY
ncbi:MAG: BBP7 family outer membrane beta-barrel protein [Planctomycetaceae bacterium]